MKPKKVKKVKALAIVKIIDGVDPHDHMIDSLIYSMESRYKPHKPIVEWKRISMKGVGDNDGYFEVTFVK